MPRARENIIAKFIAQIETGISSLISTSEPAEATRPARVRISGRPAATRAPKASTRIASVTGQETISEVSIASRFASLKSDHSSEEPVGLTCTVSVESPWSSSLRSVATRTISLVSTPAPASTTAVAPSWDRLTPGTGAITSASRGSSSRIRATSASTFGPSPSSSDPVLLLTTTWIAWLALPPKCSWASSRTATDSDPSACQPAPERFFSTAGANTPRPMTSSTQLIVTRRRCWVTHTPSRPSGPGCALGAGTGVPAWCSVCVIALLLSFFIPPGG